MTFIKTSKSIIIFVFHIQITTCMYYIFIHDKKKTWFNFAFVIDKPKYFLLSLDKNILYPFIYSFLYVVILPHISCLLFNFFPESPKLLLCKVNIAYFIFWVQLKVKIINLKFTSSILKILEFLKWKKNTNYIVGA